MIINRKELFRLYMIKVNLICEELDWKTSFGPEEIVELIVDILEKNENLIVEK